MLLAQPARTRSVKTICRRRTSLTTLAGKIWFPFGVPSERGKGLWRHARNRAAKTPICRSPPGSRVGAGQFWVTCWVFGLGAGARRRDQICRKAKYPVTRPSRFATKCSAEGGWRRSAASLGHRWLGVLARLWRRGPQPQACRGTAVNKASIASPALARPPLAQRIDDSTRFLCRGVNQLAVSRSAILQSSDPYAF